MGILVLFVLGLAQVALERHQNDLDAGAVLFDFRLPLGLDVFERLNGIDLAIVRRCGDGTAERARTLKQSMMAWVLS